MFSPLTNLTYLKLSESGISVLPPDLMAGLAKLKELVLTLSDLKRLPEGLLDPCAELQELSLNRLSLEPDSLPPGLVSRNAKLVNVTFYSGGLEHAPEGFFEGTALKRLDWGFFSSPGALRVTPFTKGVATLEKVALKYLRAGATELPADMFSGCPELRSVTLASAGLATIPAGLFDGCQELREVKIVDNRKLREIPEGLFQGAAKMVRD